VQELLEKFRSPSTNTLLAMIANVPTSGKKSTKVSSSSQKQHRGSVDKITH